MDGKHFAYWVHGFLLIKCMAPAVAIPQFKDVIDIFSDGWEAYIALTLLNWQSVMRRNI